ncbi:OmpA family protein [Mangrovimonas aestuarii]|uniref:OmpA family protein n=1 Tax=Mangrovimonas aestuarii TaxID=3018443 RepID=UPI00237832AE|nr:OmpA family protein [Mangrovimonas aestuarii]
MKKIYITAGMLLAMTASFGQSKITEKADKLYEGYQYTDAIDAYLEVVDKDQADSYTYKQLADSYYHVFNTQEAAKWYAKAVETPQDAETYYRYAECLKAQGKYEEANQQMDKFAQLSPNDQRAASYLANPNYIPSLASKSEMFEVEGLDINSEGQSDFGAVLANDGNVYFVSSRDGSNKTDKWTNEPYLDVYKSTRNTDGSLSEPKAVKELNTAYHDGPISISSDGNTIFFARGGQNDELSKKDKKNKVKVAQLGLYMAKKVDGKWTNVQPLPINSPDYSVTHPSLSADGTTLYFASNMPGGHGGTDIWKMSVNGNTFGIPENLGDMVNTPGKEAFPNITEDNVLYFASNGKPGLGGYDVFMADLSADKDAVNVGKPVNSNKDDFSFSLNVSQGIGYFSSNRNGVDNIYMAVPVCKVQAIAAVTDQKTNSILTDVQVAILDSQSNVIASKQTDVNGKVTFDVECDTEYSFKVSQDGYDTAMFTVPATHGGEVVIDAAIEPMEVIITDTEVKLKDIYFEFNKSNITAQGAEELDKLVRAMNKYPELKILVKAHTDTKGSAAYNMKLSEKRAQSTVQYVISKGISKDRITGKGFGSSEPKIDCASNCTKDQDAQNRRSEFMIVKK